VTIARPCVYLVTSRRLLSPDARTVNDEVARLEGWLEEAITAGVDVIQVREPDLPGSVLHRLVSALAAKVSGAHVAIVVNDRADVAVTSGADGVHLRGDGPPVPLVRALAPRPGWIVGRSVHDATDAMRHGMADYLLFGTVFPSASKPAGAPVAGIEALQRAAAATATPVMAIGGITPERAAACVRAGAAGVAAIAVFLPEGCAPGALGATRAVRALRTAMTGDSTSF